MRNPTEQELRGLHSLFNRAFLSTAFDADGINTDEAAGYSWFCHLIPCNGLASVPVETVKKENT